MEDIILQTKLHVPPLRPSLVSRPYLIAKLNSGLSGKLTLVSAPAGFGKTTLIVDWIAQLQHSKEAAPHACWLSLDADDNVLARFFAYLIKALQTVDDRWGETVVSLL